MPSPLYKKTLVIGATSGIGEALANKLVSQGTHVVAVGRRKERLDQFVAKHSSSGLGSALQFDILDLDKIPAFAATVAKEHSDIDCVVINAGIQRSFNFAYPETVNLKQIDEEVTTNYTSPVHLTAALLPILQRQNGVQTHLVYINATLALVPGMIRTLNYNASKGAMHNFVLGLREQLKLRKDNAVKVTEVFPPAVQTELHDTRHQPDLKDGHLIGMPLDEYTETMFAELAGGKEQFGIGMGKPVVEGFEVERVKAMHAQMEMIDKVLGKHLV